MEEVTRKSGLSAGKSDVYYFRYFKNHRGACVPWVYGNDGNGDEREGGVSGPVQATTSSPKCLDQISGQARPVVVVVASSSDRTRPRDEFKPKPPCFLASSSSSSSKHTCSSSFATEVTQQRQICFHLAEEKSKMRIRGQAGGRRVGCIVCGRPPRTLLLLCDVRHVCMTLLARGPPTVCLYLLDVVVPIASSAACYDSSRPPPHHPESVILLWPKVFIF